MSDEPTMGHIGWSPDYKSRPDQILPRQIKPLVDKQVVFAPLDEDNASLLKELAPIVEPVANEDNDLEDETIRLLPGPLNLGVEVGFTYKNWKGEVGERRAVFTGLVWGKNEWHPTPQLLLEGYDLDKKAPRTFAARDISNVHYL